MGPFRRESSSPHPPHKIPARKSPGPDKNDDSGSILRSGTASHSTSPGLFGQTSLIGELNNTIRSPGPRGSIGSAQLQETPKFLSPRPSEDLSNRSPVESYFDLAETSPKGSPSSQPSTTTLSPNGPRFGSIVDSIRNAGQKKIDEKDPDDLLSPGTPDIARSDRGSIELLEAVQFSDDSGKSKRLQLGKVKNPVVLLKSLHGQAKNLPNLWRKGTDNMGDIAGNVKGDVLDLTMVTRQGIGKGTEGLCAACSKMPFDQFQDSAAAYTLAGESDLEAEFVRPLESILKNRDWCKFCRIMFRALCLPHNDPLMSPQIQAYIQGDLRGKSFEEWATRANWMQRTLASQKIWPFGHSRDSKDAESAMSSAKYLSDFASAGTVAATQMVKDEHQARVLATVNAAVYSAMLERATEKRPLPCWVMIKMNNRSHTASGVLSVDVFSYGRAPRAPLSRISQFTLRVASECSRHSGGLGLRYGRILDRQRIDLEVAKMCLATCEHDHGPSCSSPSWSRHLEKPNALGFRVIDVQEERLVEVQSHQNPEYACLSYVWGKYETIKLTSSNLSQLSALRGLSSQRAGISKTIRAAMDVVRAVGKRFLWVDSICIKQDDEIEKKRQITQMDRIYGHALITIVAADGLSADSGLVGVTEPRKVDQIAEDVRNGVNVLIPLNHRQQLNPWNSRAWTLQEKLLSRRLLIFSGGHMIWHCRQGVAGEDMTEEDSGLRQAEIGWLTLPEQLSSVSVNFQIKALPDGSSRLIRPKLFKEYVKLVEQYTHRRMTLPEDILNAIQGLLKILENSRGSSLGIGGSSSNMHGLMEEHLDAALLWQPAGADNVRLQRRKLPRGDQLPSWSWAGWEAVEEAHYEGGVRYDLPFQVLTNNDGSLMKVLQEDGEERIKPMVRWYTVGKRPPPVPIKRGTTKLDTVVPKPRGLIHTRTSSFPSTTAGIRPSSSAKQMRPINSTGLGLRLETNTLPHEWTNAATTPALDTGEVPDEIFRTVTSNNLIFKTSSTQFRLGSSRKRTEKLYRREGTSLHEDHQLQIFETEVQDANSNVVGWLALHDPKSPLSTARWYDFIVLSEAQFFGSEDRVDIMDFPLYNVMLVEWKSKRPFAERVALGKIYKHSWKKEKYQEELIILG